MAQTLNQRIGDFYDGSSRLWEEVWGEHMHHGHYGADGRAAKDHGRAQADMIEEVFRWAGVPRPGRILDVGCGIGGSALYLAEKFYAEVVGVTLSPVQAGRAAARAQAAGLQRQVTFAVADALSLPLAGASFDLVWSIESAEHMPDKGKFVRECTRVLRPGGVLVVVTWCHRRQPPPSPGEEALLRWISTAYALPAWVCADEYVRQCRTAGLAAVRTADWSRAVAPFWPAVLRKALSPRGLRGLAAAGWRTFRGACAIPLMMAGFRRGLIEYVLVSARKPLPGEGGGHA